jgi:hypothetical protein
MLRVDPESAQCLPLEGRLAHAEALDLLLGWAQLTVGVFDFDLLDTGWNSPRRIAVLSAYFQRSRNARLEIFLRDASRINLHLPRLLALLRTHGHACRILEVGEEAQAVYDPFAIVDNRHYWHRFHYAQPRGELGVQQPAYAAELARRLREIKEVSVPAASPTILGL